MTFLPRTISTTAWFLAASFAAAAQTDASALYLSKCAICHGADGAGKTAKGKKLKMKGVKETIAKVSVEDMIEIVDHGKGTDMDAFGKQFSKDQIKGLVAYYRGLAK